MITDDHATILRACAALVRSAGDDVTSAEADIRSERAVEAKRAADSMRAEVAKLTAALATARAEAASLRESLLSMVAEWERVNMNPRLRSGAVQVCAFELRALLASPEARDAGEGGEAAK